MRRALLWVLGTGASAKTIWEVGKSLPGLEEREAFPSAEEFWERYASKSRPVVFRGAAKTFPAYRRWKDQGYLAERFGNVSMEVEHQLDNGNIYGEHPNMSLGETMSVHDFASKVTDRSIYATGSLPRSMGQHVFLLPFLNCGGFTRANMLSRFYWAAGPTRSTIYHDYADQIHCFLTGTKRVALWNVSHLRRITSKKMGWAKPSKKTLKREDMEYYESAAMIDVTSVDLQRYPGWDDLDWYDVRPRPGDCLYVPEGWSQHYEGGSHLRLPSTGSSTMSVNNFWFRPLQFDYRSCYRVRERGFDASAFLSTLRDCSWGSDHYEQESPKRTHCVARKKLPTGEERDPEFYRVPGYIDGLGNRQAKGGKGKEEEEEEDDEHLVFHPEDDDPEELDANNEVHKREILKKKAKKQSARNEL